MLKILLQPQYKTKLIIFLIFISSFLFQLFAIISYNTIQSDEPFSLYFSTPYSKLKNEFNQKNKEFDFAYVYKNFYLTDNKNLISDLKTIRLQTLDKPHPTLYYTLLRLWNINTNKPENKYLIMKARFLNLVFFIISFFLMYKLLKLLFEDKKSVIVGLCFTFFSSGIVLLFGMAREFALQCTFYIAFLLYICKFYKIINNERMLDYRESFVFGIVSGLFLLSGYYSTFYMAIYMAIILGFSLIKKNFKVTLHLLVSIIISLIIVLMLCPNYFIINQNFRAIDCINTFFNLNIPYSISSFKFFINHIIKYSYYPIILFMGICVLLKTLIYNLKNKTLNFDYKKNFLLIILMFVTLSLMYVTLLISPFNLVRYILPAFPILSLLFVILFKNLKSFTLVLIICLYFGLSIYQVSSKSYYDGDTLRNYNFKNTNTISNSPIPLFTNDDSWECVLLFFLYSEQIKSVYFDYKNDTIKIDKYFIFYPIKYPIENWPPLKIGHKGLYYISNN